MARIKSPLSPLYKRGGPESHGFGRVSSMDNSEPRPLGNARNKFVVIIHATILFHSLITGHYSLSALLPVSQTLPRTFCTWGCPDS
jgi:hypothetical protein